MDQSAVRSRTSFLARPNHCVSSVPWQWLWPLAAALFVLLAPFAAFSQTPKAANPPRTSLKGTVTTQNGDALGGATVKLAKSPPLGVPVTTTTDENGQYEFKNLQSGNYTISVEGAGFKKTERAVLLQNGQQGVQDFILNVESVAETVQVTGLAAI